MKSLRPSPWDDARRRTCCAARALRVPVFVAPAAQQVLRLASSHGLGRKDFTSVYLFLKPSDGAAPV